MAEALVLGASGFLGQRLAHALGGSGTVLRLGSRSPERQPGEGWVLADVERADSLRAAMDGCDVVVDLVHLMGQSGDLLARERAAAEAVARAAEASGVGHMVYLGGPEPVGPPSPHLAARLATGRILREGAVPTVELRCAMIVGAGSESFQMVRDLALRLPAMILPRWLGSSSSPVGVDDVIAALVHAVGHAPAASAWFDLSGPEHLTAEEILLRVAAIDGRRPFMVRVPVLTPKLSSHWIRLVSDADFAVARKLVEGLQTDLPGDGPAYWDRMPDHRLQPLDDAVRQALATGSTGRWRRRWERVVKVITPSSQTINAPGTATG